MFLPSLTACEALLLGVVALPPCRAAMGQDVHGQAELSCVVLELTAAPPMLQSQLHGRCAVRWLAAYVCGRPALGCLQQGCTRH